MKILILNWKDPLNPSSGGAEKVTMIHAKAWIDAGHSVDWFSSSFKGAREQESIEGVQLFRKGNYFTVYFYAPFFYFFRRNAYDLVIDEIHGIPFFTPFYVRKPKIALIHEVANDIWDFMYVFPLNLIGKLVERVYLQFYRRIIIWTDANSTVEELQKYGIKKKNCVVIFCPVTNEIISSLPKKEKNPTYIFVSRIVKMKGIEEVIKAFAFILKEQNIAQLWIVGRGKSEYVNRLKKMAKEYKVDKNLTFYANISDKEKLEMMRRSHLLLHASVKEGWGLVVTEAASQGTPSVVYNVSGLRDSVIADKTGIILTENSPIELARETVMLFNDTKRYEKFQNNGISWAKDLNSMKLTLESCKLIEKVVKS